MACSCKNNASNKQVTAVKQVVKQSNNTYGSPSLPKKKIFTKKTIMKRPF